MDLFNLQGKVAVVTGAGTLLGIGRSAVLRLARAGISVIYATDIRDTHFESLRSDVGNASKSCQLHAHILDAGDEAGTKALCQKVVTEQGRLDVFVANAGFVDMNNLWATELQDFVSIDPSGKPEESKLNSMTSARPDRMPLVGQAKFLQLHELNRRPWFVVVIGPYLGIKYASMAMAVTSAAKPAAKGSIIVIGSIASVTGGCGSPAYTAAKHAALGLARRGAIELAGTQIRVNCVGPGVTRTALWQNSRDIGAIKNNEPEGYHGERDLDKVDYIQQISEPDEIGNVVTFLASDLSSAINAQMLLADRGHLEQTNMTWTSQATYCGVENPPSLFS